LLVISWLVGAPVGLDANETIDYGRDIRPILSEYCYQCHGPDGNQRKADLRLDRKDGAYSVITPSDLAGSELIQRVTTDDPDLKMPPGKSKRKLTDQQKALLVSWVEQGAVWGRHWSFQRIERPAVPIAPENRSSTIRNPIDAFVQDRLRSSPLSPSPPATRSTLIRRLYLDLTGLPPTPVDVASFLADQRPDAYQRLAHRLLASPDFGERMAWDWLDAARYADSNGYQGDNDRTMWPWRDWVVSALNGGLPFDDFTTLQLAGDLIPNATSEQRLATAFCRNHMINGEGGRIAEENRVDYVMDMTETMGTVWLGLTLNCCRCHDHKFDPLLQRDYYRLFAIFNQTPVNGGGRSGQTKPVMAAPTAEQKEQQNRTQLALIELGRKKERFEKEFIKNQSGWEQEKLVALRVKPFWQSVDVRGAVAEFQQLKPLKDGSILAEGEAASKDHYEVMATTRLTKVYGVKLDALRHPSMTKNSLSRADSGNFVLTQFQVKHVQANNTSEVRISKAEATYEQGSHKVANAIDGNTDTGWAVYAGKIVDREHAAVFTFAAPIELVEGDTLQFSLDFSSQHDRHVLGRFRLSLTENHSPTLSDKSDLLWRAMHTPSDQRDDRQRKQIRESQWADSPQYQQLTKREKQLTRQLTSIRGAFAQVMVMEEIPQRRETFILNRGLYNDVTTVRVEAGTPDFLPSQAGSELVTRLELAKWIVSDENPLTARVVVNRHWQMLFGVGLVKTAEDFGSQGAVPEHRELLDWLAADFRSSGWDVKRLILTIVNSHTYRQSSHFSADAQAIDPENRLLARGARYRMPAWMIRDQALCVSGLLVDQKGGPAVNGYQPPGIWEEATFGKKVYRRDPGAALYRRSLYTFWRRIIAPTMFFDSASRQTCTVNVVRTNTPLHALLTLNDVTYVEAARTLAQRLLKDGALSDDIDRIADVYMRVLARRPSAAEVDVLQRALRRTQAQFTADKATAIDFLSMGESARDPTLAAAEHAAWTALVLAVLNLDETLTRQ
jgi:hypothetical protein